MTSLGAFTVGGMPAVQAVIPATNTEITIITTARDKVVIFSPVHDLATTAVEQQVLALFYQIIGTFKVQRSEISQDSCMKPLRANSIC